MKITYRQLEEKQACEEGLLDFLVMLNYPKLTYSEIERLFDTNKFSDLITETINFEPSYGFQLFMMQSEMREYLGWLCHNKILPQWSLDSVEFKGMNLHSISLDNTDMTRTNIEGCDLSGSTLVNSSLNRTVIQNTNMEHSDIDNTCLTYARLTKVNLKESYLVGSSLKLAVLDEVLLDNTCFEDVDTLGCIFVNCSMIRTDFDYSHLEDVKFIKSDLRGAKLGDTVLTNASFRDCTYNEYTSWPKDFDVSLHPKLIKKEVEKSKLYSIEAATTGRISCT